MNIHFYTGMTQLTHSKPRADKREAILTAALEQSRSARHNMSVLMLDVDNFKTFNDKYGHDAGDRVLRIVASTLLEVEGGGRAFRYGGEEFALIFKSSSAAEVQRVVDSVRESISRFAGDLDQPSCDGLNTWMISRAAGKEVKGVLSGLGGAG